MACKNPLRVALNQPKYIDGKFIYSVPVNCGKCQYCKKQRVTGWSFRLEQESKISNNGFFITLTYDTQNIPYCKIDTDATIRTKHGKEKKYSEEEIANNITSVPTLNKSDVQKFIKRLRIIEQEKYGKKNKEIDGELVPIKDVFWRKMLNQSYDITKPFRYYAVGEYGSKNRRPHLHLVVYNLYDTESIDEAWQLGMVEVKDLHENSISYLIKYLEKDSKHYKYIYALGLQPEFSLSSKKLGECYVNASSKKYHLNNYDNNVITLSNGVKGKLPRYIFEKLYNKTKTVGRHLKDIEEQQKEVDKYLAGLYKHIQTEADKLEAKRQKLLGDKLDKVNLSKAKNS